MEGVNDHIIPTGSLAHILKDLSGNGSLLETHEADEHIVGPGKRDDNIKFVISGAALLYLKDSFGTPQLVDRLESGDLFGEVGFFTNSPWPSDAELVAETKCEVLSIPPDRFAIALKDNTSILAPLVKKLVRKIISLDHNLLNSNLSLQSLRRVISREEHVFPDYVMGDYVRKRVHHRLEELAQNDGPVLIFGESGVGKEGLAHMVYRLSDQLKDLFLPLDMKQWASQLDLQDPSLDRDVQEQALTRLQERLFFGFEQKGPSGGVSFNPGYFELTDGGALLVRGVDTLTRTMQLKLLEAVVTQTFRRQGGVRLYKAHVRLIATTRLDPENIAPERHPLIAALMDRSVIIPALRNRRREIPGLVQRYMAKSAGDLGKSVKTVPENTMRVLVNYSWPGNDLELASTLKRAILVSTGDSITPQDIHLGMRRLEGKGKIDLLRYDFFKGLISSKFYPNALRFVSAPLFLIALGIILLGPSETESNPAAIVSWAIGWPAMVILAVLLARFWCSACPIGFIGELSQRIVSLEKPTPAFIKNNSTILLGFAIIFIVWFEASFKIRDHPEILGFFLLAMLFSAMVVSMVFQGRTWCRYLCALGGMTGLMAKSSALELRMDRNVCISQCGTYDCLQGDGEKEGCPFGLTGPKLESNRLCKICGNCVKNCKHGAININLRFPGSELWTDRAMSFGVTFLGVAMLAALLSEVLWKTPAAQNLYNWSGMSEFWAITAVFIIVSFGTHILAFLTAYISKGVFKETFNENYSRYGRALIPLTVSAFAAFHIYYSLQLGPALIDLFPGSSLSEIGRTMESIFTESVTLSVQRGILFVGLIWAFITLFLISATGHDKPGRALAGGLPYGFISIVFFFLIIDGFSHLHL